ncbi:alanine racemase [Alkaliphilus metalliredigens QYMF]|uniref:Alanine racemase n=1 Tax=Alkaliphilus metalliredigens (strain QYMF) TaxID=293826 RepID=A6TVK8_ALKMQ|nr:alanine racemase [Alkaliphilus metalliredigens]ABR50226.1 alanine racemase [Alkaliphilus metalliredigens QYMF]
MKGLSLTRPTWAEINLDHLKHNIREVKKVINKDTLLCAVVKANGYGHGVMTIAKTLLDHGADRLAVATLSEAIELRQGGYQDIPILVLGYTPETQGQVILDYNVIQTIYTYEQAKALAKIGKEQKKSMTIHLKIDTGMSRLGFNCSQKTIEEIKQIIELEYINVEGIYTHFAVADEKNKDYTKFQFNCFMELTEELKKEGYQIPIRHVSNSAAIIDLPDMNLDMVRAGIMLYGLYPSPDVNHEAVQLKQVMELKTRVAHVKNVLPQQGVSYGLTYKTKGEEKIITLPIGYADGFTRMLTDKAELILKGEKRPIVGRICMDQCMADATGIEIEQGDVVTLFSNDPASGCSIDDIARKLNTINYEIVCMVGRRVPRAYLENNNLLHIHDSLVK